MSFYLRMDGQKQVVILDMCAQCAKQDSANTVFEVMEHGGVHCRGCGKLYPLDETTQDMIAHPEKYLTHLIDPA